MNEQLLKFIELCLVDGIISDKEREVIFRKSKELGVPEDECEIILEGMITKLDNSKHISSVNVQKSKVKDLKIKESYSDDSEYKSWFLDWLNIDKKIQQLKNNQSSILKDIIIEEIGSSELKWITPDKFINEDTIKKMCDLESIPDIPDSFWKKGVKGKKGSLESSYKDDILNVLQNENFICYLTSSKMKDALGEMIVHWHNEDLLQMIEHYHNPTKYLEEKSGRWYKLMKSKYAILCDRHCVLITDKSILEFNEKGLECSQIKLDDITFSIFSDKFGYFDINYLPIEGVFKSEKLCINGLIPHQIEHNNEKFIQVINEIGLNDQTKRIINFDEKIQEFVNSNFNSQLNRLKGEDFYLFGFKSTKDIMGRERFQVVESFIVNSLHSLSLELFNIYLRLLSFRDSLVNMLLKKQEVELEGILLKFENSQFGMSKFEQTTLSQLEEINENLFKLKEVTKEGFKEMSEKLDLVVEELDSINDSNKEIVESLGFNNFISLVNTYQLYKINKNTKNLS